MHLTERLCYTLKIEYKVFPKGGETSTFLKHLTTTITRFTNFDKGEKLI